MRFQYVIFWLMLAAYSALLLMIEWHTSQDYVRQYFTDIEGDQIFFAVNTTLSVFLLAATSLFLLFSAFANQAKVEAQARPFLVVQALMFGLLAFDDRFQLHERLAYRLDIPDHYIMAIWGLAELVILFGLLKPRHISVSMAVLFVSATGLFAVMMFFDAIVPHDMRMRLSIEDLAKTWASAMYFAFAWQTARFHLFQSGQALIDASISFPIGKVEWRKGTSF